MLTLVLASASPRRRELLERAGIAFTVDAADVDETPRPGEAPLVYAARVAADKAATVAARRAGVAVLAADTVVTIDGAILGKAESDAEARAMLTQLAGRTHVVATAVALRVPAAGGAAAPAAAPPLVVASEVDVRALDAADLDAYVASGEWRGKAGAYAIQGIGAALVRAVRGSYTNVVGLPLVETLELLARADVARANLARGIPA